MLQFLIPQLLLGGEGHLFEKASLGMESLYSLAPSHPDSSCKLPSQLPQRSASAEGEQIRGGFYEGNWGS